MSDTYSVAFVAAAVAAAPGVLVPVAVKFAGDEVIAVTTISGPSPGTDVLSDFGQFAPAAGLLAQISSPAFLAGSVCLVTLRTAHTIL